MFFIFFTFYFSLNTRKVVDTMVMFAKIIKEDMMTTKAFRAIMASTFDGSDLNKVVAWIYKMDGLFKAAMYSRDSTRP